MKLMHLSDLHLGKRLHEFSLLDDQTYILNEIIQITREEQPTAVMIAGDIYDKSDPPPAGAIQLFDEFLYQLSELVPHLFIISGNHDSQIQIAFGGRLLERGKVGVHIAPVYDGNVTPIALRDAFGFVYVYMLPFLKPIQLRRLFPEREIRTYTDAMRTAVDQMNVQTEHRNILITHQFVAGAARSDSEEISVGGSDPVDVSVFAAFDYVALGHIHRPQTIGNARYCGTPLKYSFSEASSQKSVTIVEMGAKGNCIIRTVPLIPKRDLKELSGTYMELTDRSHDSTAPIEDYVHIILTDEQDIPEAMGKLRVIYPNLMKLDYDNLRTRSNSTRAARTQKQLQNPLDLFSEFYRMQNNQDMSTEQREFMRTLIASVWNQESEK